MPDPVTGTIAAVTGATSLFGSISASNAASDATDAQSAAEAAALNFQKQQYQDWQDTFGPIQDNLSMYYQNISPDYYEATGLANFQKERQQQLTDLNTSLAQRGLTNSGLAATVKRENAIDTAEQRAQIRTGAKQQAVSDMSNFLQIGMGSNPSSSYGSTLNQIAQNKAVTAANANQAAGTAVGSTVNSLLSMGTNYALTGNPLGVSQYTAGVSSGGLSSIF